MITDTLTLMSKRRSLQEWAEENGFPYKDVYRAYKEHRPYREYVFDLTETEGAWDAVESGS